MRKRAASYVAPLEAALGRPVAFEPGRLGSFKVFVGDELIAERKGGLIAKLIKRPWPEVERVCADARAALDRAGG